ncbi:MAG: CHAD domain-containing protein, partial [Pseudonocardia sp.]|nr:CHAD domain-containing protein [Pseudonocardia sp.]
RATALTALNSKRYLRLHRAIDALLVDPPFTARAHRPARRELPRSVARAHQRLQARMAAAQALPTGQRDEALHETRKGAKRLRYATETVQPVIGRPAERLQRRLKAVQQLLGEHQDTVVSRPALRELATRAHLEGGNGFTFGILHVTEAERAHAAEQALPAAWRRMHTKKNTSWLLH